MNDNSEPFGRVVSLPECCGASEPCVAIRNVRDRAPSPVIAAFALGVPAHNPSGSQALKCGVLE